MNFTKKLVSIFFLSVLLIACGDDDEPEVVDVIVQPTVTLDVETIIALPPFSDITSIVDYGQAAGESAADVVSEVNLNDIYLLPQPGGLASGDLLVYEYVAFFDETNEFVDSTDNFDLFIDDKLEMIIPPGVTGFADAEEYYFGSNDIEQVALRIIDADEADDIEWKYEISLYIVRNETMFGPYIIDPRIRIKSRTSSFQ